MSGGSRSLPGRPSLRFLKLEAKRRLAAGEFATLHDAQAAIAWEHDLPSWAALKQVCACPSEPESHALDQLRWVISRFSGADAPGWTAPGEDEIREHFDDRFLAVLPARALVEQVSKMAADLRAELVVIRAAPLEAYVQLAGLRYVAVADATPPHRLTGLRGFPVGDGITDPRVKAPPPARTLGELPGEMAGEVAGGVVGLAEEACAELGLPALVLAGGEPGRAPWVVAIGWANLGGANLGGANLGGTDPDRAEPLEAGHRFSVPGVTALVTATAVLRLVADGRVGLDTPANDHLRAVRLADDSVTVRELLCHTGGVDNPAPLFGDSIPDLATLMGPVISCGGPRGTVQPSNGGYAVLGQLIADVTGQPYARAASRLVLDPLGMRDSSFPDSPADIGPGAVTGYTVTADGVFEAFPARIATVPAIAGLWSTGADLVRLGTGWSSLLPAALAREALTAVQAEPGPGGLRAGFGWLLAPGDQTAVHGGAGLDAVALLRSRIRDGRTHVVLTSRTITVESIDNRLLRSWTNPTTPS
jgi:CubicO group peptidase (beta-lactamase class C family)